MDSSFLKLSLLCEHFLPIRVELFLLSRSVVLSVSGVLRFFDLVLRFLEDLTSLGRLLSRPQIMGLTVELAKEMVCAISLIRQKAFLYMWLGLQKCQVRMTLIGVHRRRNDITNKMTVLRTRFRLTCERLRILILKSDKDKSEYILGW